MNKKKHLLENSKMQPSANFFEIISPRNRFGYIIIIKKKTIFMSLSE